MPNPDDRDEINDRVPVEVIALIFVGALACLGLLEALARIFGWHAP